MAYVDQHIEILEEISQFLGQTLSLRRLFRRTMAILAKHDHVHTATLWLWSQAANELRISAAVGLSYQQIRQGRCAGEQGPLGKVLATGQPVMIPDLHREPSLDRSVKLLIYPSSPAPLSPADTGVFDVHCHQPASEDTATSFLAVPIRSDDRHTGVIAVVRPFVDSRGLEAQAKLLNIIAGSFSQAVRFHHAAQLEKGQWLQHAQQLRENLRTKYRFDNIIGASPAMQDVLATIGQVASSRATCLILGETGCGKELIAKAIHYNSPRRNQPLVRVNCSALNHQLLESELFGHVRGAFTGAIRDAMGRFEAADGGSIFLDEIGTLDPSLQVKLLRVLQERQFERVGDHQPMNVDVRVIAATNLDLEEEVRKGTFREDLYYRLNVVSIHLPPLRSRREDIPTLIDHFLDRYNKDNQRCVRTMSQEVLDTLLRYPWPGNVRELENAVERAVVLSTGEQLTEDLLPLQIRLFAKQVRGKVDDESIDSLAQRLAQLAVKQHGGREGSVHSQVVGQIERHLIAEALALHNDVKLRAADFLGINRNTLHAKLKELNIQNDRMIQ